MIKEVNKYPFTESSSLLITNLGYTLPMGTLLDANLYPHAENKPPFYISSIKRRNNISTLTVNDSSGSIICEIKVPLDNGTSDYACGYGVQGNTYCGGCLLGKGAINTLRSLPDIDDIPSNSLMFSAGTIHPVPNDMQNNRGRLLYNGIEVTKVSWGSNLEDGTIKNSPVKDVVSSKPINTISVNGVELTGESVFITTLREPGITSVFRVISSDDILIGRLAEV